MLLISMPLWQALNQLLKLAQKALDVVGHGSVRTHEDLKWHDIHSCAYWCLTTRCHDEEN